MQDDDQDRPLVNRLPNNVGFKMMFSHGKYLLFEDENLVLVIQDIEELAQVFDDARFWLRAHGHPILKNSLYGPPYYPRLTDN